MKSRIYASLSLFSLLCLMPSFAFAQSSGGVPALQQDLVALTVVVSNVNADLQTTKGSLAVTKNDLADTKAELAQAKSELASTKALLTATQSDLANTQNDLMSVQAGLQSEIDSLQSEVASLEADTIQKTDTLLIEKVSKTELATKEQVLRTDLASKTELASKEQQLVQTLASKAELISKEQQLVQTLASKTELADKETQMRTDLASKLDLQSREQQMRTDLASKTDLQSKEQQMRTDLASKTELQSKEAQLRTDLTSKQEASAFTKTDLKLLAERFKAIQELNQLTDLTTAGGASTDVAKTSDILNKLEQAADAFEAAAALELVQELGHQAGFTQAAATAKASVTTAKQDLAAGQQVKTTEVYEKVVSEMEKEMQSLSDTAEIVAMDLQMNMQRRTSAYQTLSNIMKKLHDTSAAIIANLK